MKRTLIGSVAAATLGLAMTVSAQQPPQPQPSQPTPPAQAAVTADADKPAKLSGCLKSGATPGTFELATGKKAKMAPTSADAASPAQPPASTSSQAPTQDAMAKAGARNVTLAAGTGVDLAAHLNHQVELTGTWQSSIAAAASADAAKSGKTFNVTAVKMVSATCTTGTD
jgi:hypothetical protein